MENSFFRWFNHDLQRVREQILLAGDGRSNISASLRRIFAAGMRRGRRVLITISAYSCEIIVPETRFDPFVPRIFAVSANRSTDSISRDYTLWASATFDSLPLAKTRKSFVVEIWNFQSFANLIETISKISKWKDKKGRGKPNELSSIPAEYSEITDST